MFSNRNGTMEKDFLPRVKTWKTVRQTRNQDAAHAHKRVTAPLITLLLRLKTILYPYLETWTFSNIYSRPWMYTAY